MKRIIKKDSNTYIGIVRDIHELSENGTDFFFGQIVSKRFAIPKKSIYNNKGAGFNDFGIEFNLDVSRAVLASIDYESIVLGYKYGDYRHFKVCTATTKEKLVDAVKLAKKRKQEYVIDLHTGKIIETNG